ncbi:hypothetical protein TWF694_006386 [Orbilia ellipsospora]|uniref:Beta-lactamase-related domain-containing protein n=1 Tax=Orbilia ellipsospora TaxID=2528407 RepID=A0AAV9XKX0_9PEZI
MADEKQQSIEQAEISRHGRLRSRDVGFLTLCLAIGSLVGAGLTLLAFRALIHDSSPLTPTLVRRDAPSPKPTGYTGKTVASTDNGAPSPWKCIPPPPQFLLKDSRIASHPGVIAALSDIKSLMEANAKTNPNDAVSVSIVHASKGKIFDFHSGRIRTNESATASPARVDGDSIYRIASISKMFVALETLVLGKQARLRKFIPEISFESRLQEIMPEFRLPVGFENDAAEITLAQLGSHTAGLARDVGDYLINDLHDIKFPPASDGMNVFDIYPAVRTDEEFLKQIAERPLIWKVGETPSYSNTGFDLFGMALTRYRQKMYGNNENFNDMMKKDIFEPVGMKHSFSGAIPAHLRRHITTPTGSSDVDKVFPLNNNPAGGIFSSSNDLAALLYKVIISTNPLLVSPGQRQSWLKSQFQMTDGLTSVGIPWETHKAVMPDYSTYNIYTKGGGLPSQFSLISTLPEFGYGIVALTSIGITDKEFYDGKSYTNPTTLSLEMHNILAPAVWKAYNDILVEDYVGKYASKDGSAHASIVFKEGMLVMESFVNKDIDLLYVADEVMWTEMGKTSRVFVGGGKLVPTGFEGQFRLSLLYTCVWAIADSLTTKDGWGVDKMVIKKDKTGRMAIDYRAIIGAPKLYKLDRK